MKYSLKKYVNDLKPDFEKGGKYEKWHTVFDGFATFLFVPDTTTKLGETHIKAGIDLKRTMIFVVLAMIPCLLFGMWNVGHQHFLSQGEFLALTDGFFDKIWFGAFLVIPIVAVSYITGLTIEFFIASRNGHSINEGFLVSGMLIPLVMPATIPLWMVALATAFAVIFAKEVFGGTGMNIMNVALTARVFLFFGYPTFISGDECWVAGMEGKVDAFSGATALANSIKGDPGFDFFEMFMGFIPGSIGETSTLMILLGAAFLLITGIGSWRIMLSALIGGICMGLIFNGLAVNEFMQVPWYTHLVMGGFAFGVVFMATDPVTAAQTAKGKYIYGFLIGFFAIMIRVFNPAYPEGIMMAILLMNVFAPTIDHYVVQGNIKKRQRRLAHA